MSGRDARDKSPEPAGAGRPRSRSPNSASIYRKTRRLYMGGLPQTVPQSQQQIKDFVNREMRARNLCTGPGDPVTDVTVNGVKFAFVEFRSVEETTAALSLTGTLLEGAAVRFNRPSDYNGPSSKSAPPHSYGGGNQQFAGNFGGFGGGMGPMFPPQNPALNMGPMNFLGDLNGMGGYPYNAYDLNAMGPGNFNQQQQGFGGPAFPGSSSAGGSGLLGLAPPTAGGPPMSSQVQDPYNKANGGGMGQGFPLPGADSYGFSPLGQAPSMDPYGNLMGPDIYGGGNQFGMPGQNLWPPPGAQPGLLPQPGLGPSNNSYGPSGGGGGGGGSFVTAPPIADPTLRQQSRTARRIHIGNLPTHTGLTTDRLNEFICNTMEEHGLTVRPGPCLIGSQILGQGKFGFLEFRTMQEATNSLSLAGTMLDGKPLKILRASDYKPVPAAELAAMMGKGVVGGPADGDMPMGAAAVRR